MAFSLMTFVCHGETNELNSLIGCWQSIKNAVKTEDDEIFKDSFISEYAYSEYYIDIKRKCNAIYLKEFLYSDVDGKYKFPSLRNSRLNEFSFIEYDHYYDAYLMRQYNLGWHSISLFTIPLRIEDGKLYGDFFRIGEEVSIQKQHISDERKQFTLEFINKNTFGIQSKGYYTNFGGYGHYSYVQDLTYNRFDDTGTINSIDDLVGLYLLWFFISDEIADNNRINAVESEFAAIKKDSHSKYKDVYENIKEMQKFIDSFSGTWTYKVESRRIKNFHRNEITFEIVSNFGVVSGMNFPLQESILFYDYVLEYTPGDLSALTDYYMTGTDDFRKKLWEKYPPKNPVSKKMYGRKRVKPMQFLYLDAPQKRLYLMKSNEIMEETKDGFLSTLYTAYYYIDLSEKMVIPNEIEWKYDYTRSNPRAVVAHPWRLRWKISQDKNLVTEESMRYLNEKWEKSAIMKRKLK